MLQARGLRSDELRSLVVNPLEIDGGTYLLGARGESNWVKNLRPTGEARLRRGRRNRSFRARELADDEELPIMRAYLARWGWQVKGFMGVDDKSGDDDIRAILPRRPVLRIET